MFYTYVHDFPNVHALLYRLQLSRICRDSLGFANFVPGLTYYFLLFVQKLIKYARTMAF